jgi:uncharacterized protein YecT (DUF1311 family)
VKNLNNNKIRYKNNLKYLLLNIFIQFKRFEIRANKKMFVIAILVFVMNTAFSQSSDEKVDNNAIDISLKACLDSAENQTTVGMVGCTAEAERLWDAEMNKYYKLLQGMLSQAEMAKLKASQIKWLEFRDAEFSTSSMIYNDLQGTMWRIVSMDTEMQVVKQRALGLKSYYDNLNMH